MAKKQCMHGRVAEAKLVGERESVGEIEELMDVKTEAEIKYAVSKAIKERWRQSWKRRNRGITIAELSEREISG